MAPKPLYVTKTYYLLHFSYIPEVPRPPKYRYFGSQNRGKIWKYRHIGHHGTKIPKSHGNKSPWCQDTMGYGVNMSGSAGSKYQYPSRARPFRPTGWVSLVRDPQHLTPKSYHFGNMAPKPLYVTKTHYLLHFSYILSLPRPSKYRYFWSQNGGKISKYRHISHNGTKIPKCHGTNTPWCQDSMGYGVKMSGSTGLKYQSPSGKAS